MRRRKSLGCQPADVQCVGKAANNKGYTFAADGKRYIIKFYRSKEWPEAGKLPLVYQKRKLYGIPRAELLLYEHGKCLSEQEIDGVAADEIAMDEAQKAACYKKLALDSLLYYLEICDHAGAERMQTDLESKGI